MMKKCQCGMMKFCGLLVAIGGINWGLVGIGMIMGQTAEAWNVVHMIFSFSGMVEGIVYLLVGIATVMVLVGCKCAKCKACKTGGMDKGAAPMGGAPKM